jgi:hypothetical protein
MTALLVMLGLLLTLVVVLLLRTGPWQTLVEHFRPRADGCTILLRCDFDQHRGSFTALGATQLDSSDDSCGGQALQLRRVHRAGEFGVRGPLYAEGVEGLKIAYLCKAHGVPRAMLNIWNRATDDNITPRSYRCLSSTEWHPILYHVETFRPNAGDLQSPLPPRCLLQGLTLFGEQPGSADTWMRLDNFAVYRGSDRMPPERVANVRAEPTTVGICLTWDPAADNVGVMVYVVSRAEGAQGVFHKIAETAAPSWVDRIPASGVYHYRVLACDFEENLGDWSDAVRVRADGPLAVRAAAPEVEERAGYAENLRAIAHRGSGRLQPDTVLFLSDSAGAPERFPLEIEAAIGVKRVRMACYPGQAISSLPMQVSGALNDHQPALLLVRVGADSPRTAPDIAPAMAALAEIAAAAAERGIVPVLSTLPPGDGGGVTSENTAFNRALIELCQRLRLPCCDLAETPLLWTDRATIEARAWKRVADQIYFVLRDRP